MPLIDRPSSGDLVAIHVRTLIFNGELRQGDRVHQDDIARQLGVSRIPVREAIIALDREGWLTITPAPRRLRARSRRGRVARPLRAARSRLRARGAPSGRPRSTPDRGATARRAGRRCRRRHTRRSCTTPTTSFLRTLLAMARSPRLGSVMRNMSTVVPGNFFALVPGSGITQQEGTSAIVDAIDAGDADRAADACVDAPHRPGRPGDQAPRVTGDVRELETQ